MQNPRPANENVGSFLFSPEEIPEGGLSVEYQSKGGKRSLDKGSVWLYI